MNNDFIRLNQNYQDYMRELNSVKAEEMMKTTEFLVFKDRLIEYLRSFVRSLQVNAAFIEQCLKNTDRQVLRCLLEKIIQYELLIPRIDVEVKEDLIADKVYAVGRVWRNGLPEQTERILRRQRYLTQRMRSYERLQGMRQESVK